MCVSERSYVQLILVKRWSVLVLLSPARHLSSCPQAPFWGGGESEDVHATRNSLLI